MNKEKARKTGMITFLAASTIAAILAYTTGFGPIAGGLIALGLLVWGITLGITAREE
ncbi:MAG: hypothetical protein KDC66_02080 [Phaeodactylibacter sp.]|nr:hypothetical protein [Phaeodactylibacter sp.]MCB9273450.1 hypothetical protein [Lewinellaceae bacterium]